MSPVAPQFATGIVNTLRYVVGHKRKVAGSGHSSVMSTSYLPGFEFNVQSAFLFSKFPPYLTYGIKLCGRQSGTGTAHCTEDLPDDPIIILVVSQTNIVKRLKKLFKLPCSHCPNVVF